MAAIVTTIFDLYDSDFCRIKENNYDSNDQTQEASTFVEEHWCGSITLGRW